jgi:hypothetical protein
MIKTRNRTLVFSVTTPKTMSPDHFAKHHVSRDMSQPKPQVWQCGFTAESMLSLEQMLNIWDLTRTTGFETVHVPCSCASQLAGRKRQSEDHILSSQTCRHKHCHTVGSQHNQREKENAHLSRFLILPVLTAHVRRPSHTPVL